MTPIDRRTFLRRLGFGTVSAAAAACVFDVEKLLWIPGEKTIIEVPGLVVATGLPNIGYLVAEAWCKYVGSLPPSDTPFQWEWVTVESSQARSD